MLVRQLLIHTQMKSDWLWLSCKVCLLSLSKYLAHGFAPHIRGGGGGGMVGGGGIEVEPWEVQELEVLEDDHLH